MVLVDTSVWVLHLREGYPKLESLLDSGMVVCHPMVIGELACGNIKNRDEIIGLLQDLSTALPAEHEEVLELIKTHRLMGKGLGLVDMHLLTSALLTDVPLWTLDKKLKRVASNLHIAM